MASARTKKMPIIGRAQARTAVKEVVASLSARGGRATYAMVARRSGVGIPTLYRDHLDLLRPLLRSSGGQLSTTSVPAMRVVGTALPPDITDLLGVGVGQIEDTEAETEGYDEDEAEAGAKAEVESDEVEEASSIAAEVVAREDETPETAEIEEAVEPESETASVEEADEPDAEDLASDESVEAADEITREPVDDDWGQEEPQERPEAA